MTSTRPLLLVDADDTLWENYRFFADVVAAWSRWMEARGVETSRAVAALEAAEDRNIPRTGYGSAPFVASLADAFHELRPDAGRAEVADFAEFASNAEFTLRNHPIALLPGVAEGVAALARHTRLVLFTKGRDDEQRAKLERSGLAPHFHGVTVVREKHVAVFAAECERHRTDAAHAWMIGNSARSDVNPARLAGLRTIHVPHAAPWHRDEEPLVADGIPTLVARTFSDVPGLVGRGRVANEPV